MPINKSVFREDLLLIIRILIRPIFFLGVSYFLLGVVPFLSDSLDFAFRSYSFCSYEATSSSKFPFIELRKTSTHFLRGLVPYLRSERYIYHITLRMDV